MRKQYFKWSWLVLGLVLSVYGAFSLVYNHTHNKDFSVLGLVFLVIGLVLLVLYFVLLLISLVQKKKAKNYLKQETPKVEEEPIKESSEVIEDKKPVITEKITPKMSDQIKKESNRSYSRPREFSGGSGYIKRIGEGPVIRISEEEILDMRSNTYYRIEDNYVKQMGCGPVFEFIGNKIKLAYGGYLFELSGSNINKVYGGFFASISGGFLKTYDLSQNYEIPRSLNKYQILAVAALLFKD